uniref:Uncharacterized protein n=1 Tax=Arundo donax TaxID=35708 RepID=A0A0A9DJ55_ARUDO
MFFSAHAKSRAGPQFIKSTPSVSCG